MAHWTTVSFIRAFMHGQLGRKRVHGTYRVLEGDHCKVLVRASTNYGRPSGSNLIGIRLDNDLNVSFFHNHNTRCFTYRMTKELDKYNAPKLPGDILSGGDANLLASGIIDIDGHDVLIELGDKPYLLHRKLKDEAPVTGWSGGCGSRWVTLFDSLDRVSTRVASVAGARELIKDPEGMEMLCEMWWVQKMADTFIPPALEDEYIKALSSPVNPLDYGYRLDDCVIVGSLGSGATRALTPTDKLLDEPHDHRARSYITARDNWNTACEKLQNRTPLEFRGLSTKKDKYSYTTAPAERTGSIVRTSEGVYVQGKFASKENWETQQRLDNWHKLHAPSTRVKIG